MYLAKLRIENYRAIRNATLSCENGITVMIGENGCGKSSVLNALEACLGRKLHGEEFDIKPSDFFNDFDAQTQASHLEIELFFCHPKDANPLDAVLYGQAPPPSHQYQGPLNEDQLQDQDNLLSFSILVQCERQDSESVDVHYSVHNSQGQEVLAERKSEILVELRRLCPLMRIRSSVLRPPTTSESVIPADASEEERSRLQVEHVLKQAYSDLLREADYNAEQSLRQESEKMNAFYAQLDAMLKRTSPNAIGRVAAPLSPLNDWMHYVSLLRGSGARSVAMLYFAGAFFEARGEEVIGPDTRPIISIEYPETNLHPLMLTSLWNLINRLPAQLLVSTYCVELLSAIPFRSLRRLVRSNAGDMSVYQVPASHINLDDMRRIAYHLRVRRGAALFMRVWLLVEGETEYWLLPEIASTMNFDLWQEGIEFIEFAQCGLEPLVKLANSLGISWFLLCDGDKAGQTYAQKAEHYARSSHGLGHVVCLSSVDIEHSFWDSGYADVFIEAAGVDKAPLMQTMQQISGGNNKKKSMSKLRAKAMEISRDVIKKAVKRTSKPGLALKIAEAVTTSGLGVPSDIEHLIYNVVRVARQVGGGEGNYLEGYRAHPPQQEPNDDYSSQVTYEVMDEYQLADEPIDSWRCEYIDSAEDLLALEQDPDKAEEYDDGEDADGQWTENGDDERG